MTIDEQLYQLPLIGRFIRRLYSYFKNHILFTDVIHIATGFGLGLILAGGSFFRLGVLALSIGIAGHLFAFLKGK